MWRISLQLGSKDVSHPFLLFFSFLLRCILESLHILEYLRILECVLTLERSSRASRVCEDVSMRGRESMRRRDATIADVWTEAWLLRTP